MSRIYPAWNEATKHLFVSEKDIPLRKVGAGFTAPFVFHTDIPLLGKNAEQLVLNPEIAVETFYVYIRELGVIAIDVFGRIMSLGILDPQRSDGTLICTRLELAVPQLPEASILISLLGSMNFKTGVVEFSPQVLKTTGLGSEPILLGYDIVLGRMQEEVVG